MMHVVAEARRGGVFGVGDLGAGAVDRGADVSFGQRQHPDRVEAGGVEALGVDAVAERCVEAPLRLKALSDPEPGRQLEDDEPVGAGRFYQSLYVLARARSTR